MEAALKKKEAQESAEAQAAVVAELAEKEQKKKKKVEIEPDWVDTTKTKYEVNEKEEVFYGAPDDVAWNDKSLAQRKLKQIKTTMVAMPHCSDPTARNSATKSAKATQGHPSCPTGGRVRGNGCQGIQGRCAVCMLTDSRKRE